MDNLASRATNTRKFVLASCFRRIVPVYITPRGWGWINMLWWTREGEEEGKGGFFRAGLGGEWLAGD